MALHLHLCSSLADLLYRDTGVVGVVIIPQLASGLGSCGKNMRMLQCCAITTHQGQVQKVLWQSTSAELQSKTDLEHIVQEG